jgi:hypothetical protein
LIQKHNYIDANQEFTRCGNHQTSSHSLEDWGDLSLLSSLLYDMKHTHTWQKLKPKVKGVGDGSILAHAPPTLGVLFIVKTKD